MIQYIIILLDDTSVSFCHYSNDKTEHRLIPLSTLKKGLLFSMKENLNVQFVYPNYELPKEYLDLIDTVDHVDIKPASANVANILVINGFPELTKIDSFDKDTAYVIKTDKKDLFHRYEELTDIIKSAARVNIVINDIESFTEEDFKTYKSILEKLSNTIERLYEEERSPQLNVLTDRMMLESMNNCGAGDTTITLAPDGNFYVCPAFYYAGNCDGKEKSEGEVCEKGYNIGSLAGGLNIKNEQLYKLDHATICRHCDAWQCKRCIWLNRKTTLEVNTPSHEQCVIAHLERNASRSLLSKIRRHGVFLSNKPEIKQIDYLDPFDKREQWL